MDLTNASIVRLEEKLKTITGRSEYLFHFGSHRVQDDLCYFEGYYRDSGLKAGLHIHKNMTEIFTVVEGEFSFHLPTRSEILCPGDTIIARPFQPHGFSTNVPGSRMQIISIGFKNRESFFIELSKIVNEEVKLSPEEMETFFNRYDQYSYKSD